MKPMVEGLHFRVRRAVMYDRGLLCSFVTVPAKPRSLALLAQIFDFLRGLKSRRTQPLVNVSGGLGLTGSL
jgi:hypothetical protein